MAREPEKDEITLGVLSAIEGDSAISQRTLSEELGVALGLANAYLKRCVRKGYIKIQQVPRRRYAYYLTPQGFAEKARLTGEYLSSSLQFFRRARGEMGDLMHECLARGFRRIALAGATELAEIATLTAHGLDIELVGVVHEEANGGSFCGLPMTRRLQDLGPVDAVIVTRMTDIDGLWAELAAHVGEERVFAPRLVKVAHLRERSRPAARRR
jgi:DNA-binding MarR family transcriptional regulator